MPSNKSYEKKLKMQIILSWLVTLLFASLVITIFVLDFIFWRNIILKIIGGIGTIIALISAIITLKKQICKKEDENV